jgi:hypothetical protein
MKRRAGLLWALLPLACGVTAASVPPPHGRWEGRLPQPGLDQAVVIDIAIGAGSSNGHGNLTARVTLPGRSLQRATVAPLRLQSGAWQGQADGGPGAETADALRLSLRPRGHRLAGTLTWGGHTWALDLERTGDAVSTERVLAPLPEALRGRWSGRYDMGFGTRELTLEVAPAGSTIVVVGRRRTELRVDHAGRDGASLVLRASAADLSIEADWAEPPPGQLKATIRQGPFEAPLLLQREARS